LVWSLIEGTEIYLFRVYGFFLNSFWWVRASFLLSLVQIPARITTRRPLNNNGFLKSAFVSFAKDTRHPLESKSKRFLSSFGLLVVK
jgi:hypothetical protein